MFVFGLFLSVFGVGFLCWLVFTLAVYALPFYAGMMAGFAAYHSGAGAAGAIVVGVACGAITLTVGRIAFAFVRWPLARIVIALAFTIPAVIAGYYATLGLAQMAVPSVTWRELFAIIGALAIGVTAFMRIASFAPPVVWGEALAEPDQSPLRRRSIATTGRT
jgi:hypothetical protein